MIRSYFLGDKKSLLRQAIAAWGIVTAGTILFTLIALWITPVIGSEEFSIIAASLVILPILVVVHIWLYKHKYYFWKVTNDLKAREYPREHLLQAFQKRFADAEEEWASYHHMAHSNMWSLSETKRFADAEEEWASYHWMLGAPEGERERRLVVVQALSRVLQERSESTEMRQVAVRALVEMASLEQSNMVLRVLHSLELSQKAGGKQASYHWMLGAPEGERERRLVVVQALSRVLQERSESTEMRQVAVRALVEMASLEQSNMVLRVLHKLELSQKAGGKQASYHWMLHALEGERERRLIVQTLSRVLQDESEPFTMRQEIKKSLRELSIISAEFQSVLVLATEKRYPSEQRKILVEVLSKLSAESSDESAG